MITTTRICLLLALAESCVTAGQKNGSVPVRGPCGLPLDEEICTAICPIWYFDASVGCCLPFTYGCSGGNDNNFITRQLCENVCSENNRGRLCKFNYHVNHLYYVIKALQRVFCLNKLLFWGIELVVF
ncbi:boophilin-H2-like [Crassostrea virginica]